MIKVNGEDLNVTMFPDNTSQVWQVPVINRTPKRFDIEFNFTHEGEVMHLAQLVRLIRQARVPVPINLHMPFLPYGRQDKSVSNDSTFALEVFANIINDMHFNEVTTLDAHSGVGYGLFKNFRNIHPSENINRALLESKANAIAFPDAGALDRYKEDLYEFQAIVGEKVRDQKTGYIKEYSIQGNPADHNVLIVDDICDGGMTFKLLARDLLKAGAKSVNLYVTHGIFSKGVKTLLDDGISRIFTKDGEIFPSKQTNYLIRRFE